MLEADTQEYLQRGRERDVNSAPGLYGRSDKKKRWGKKKNGKAAFSGVKYSHDAPHAATLLHCIRHIANAEHVVSD